MRNRANVLASLLLVSPLQHPRTSLPALLKINPPALLISKRARQVPRSKRNNNLSHNPKHNHSNHRRNHKPPRAHLRLLPRNRRRATATATTASIVPAGTALTVQVDQPISTKTAKEGDVFTATVSSPVMVHEKPVIPKGARAQGVVLQSKSPGKFKGEGALSVKLTGVTVKGASYPVETAANTTTEKSKGKRSAVMIGGGGGGGALIGGIAGGGKGAAMERCSEQAPERPVRIHGKQGTGDSRRNSPHLPPASSPDS